MRSILLVAAREYRQITQTRGFWVLLLVVPVIIAVTQIGGRFIRPPPSIAYYAVDASGEFAPAVDRRLRLTYQRQVLSDLAAYVERWEIPAAQGDLWGGGQRFYTDEEVEAFASAGGADAAMEKLKPVIPKEAPSFEPMSPPFVRADLPAGFDTNRNSEELGAAFQPLLEENAKTDEGDIRADLAIYIPPGFGAGGGPARVWTSGRPNQGLVATIRTELTRILKDKAMRDSGLSPEAFDRINATSAPLLLTAPPQGSGRERVQIRSVLPLMLSYLLLMTVMTTGGLMLQGVLEEKSNKLLESVLACISPSELMNGKLLGLGGVGFTIILVWLGVGIGAAFAMQGAVADFLQPALAAFDQPWMAPALIFYFVTGYIIISMIYLAVGALSSSLQDAQAYLMPVIFVITLPIVFMMITVVQDPDGLLPRVLSWIPIYTPFAMLGRIGGGVTIVEVLGTGAMLAVFVILEMWALGKLFQSSILRTGQPPALASLIKSVLRKSGNKAKA